MVAVLSATQRFGGTAVIICSMHCNIMRFNAFQHEMTLYQHQNLKLLLYLLHSVRSVPKAVDAAIALRIISCIIQSQVTCIMTNQHTAQCLPGPAPGQ
jgi:hypothetical protein